MFRSTTTGSYPRIGSGPGQQRLRQALARRDRGATSEEELRAVEASVLSEVTREQADAGVDLVTDGQVTWYDAPSHFASHLTGFRIGSLERYFDTNTYYRRPEVDGEVRWSRPITLDDWRVASRASETPVKAILLGPHTLASMSVAPPDRRPEVTREVARALSHEVRALREAGLRYLQIDEPWMAKHGVPADYGEIAHELLRGRGEVHTTLFVSFGGVDAGDLLTLPFDAFGLDLVERASTLDSLRGIDTDKGICFGLLDSRNTRSESPADIADMVLSFRRGVPLDLSFLCPSNGLEFLPRRKALEKLRTLVSATEKIRGALS